VNVDGSGNVNVNVGRERERQRRRERERKGQRRRERDGRCGVLRPLPFLRDLRYCQIPCFCRTFVMLDPVVEAVNAGAFCAVLAAEELAPGFHAVADNTDSA
jgi:hypothetical protein